MRGSEVLRLESVSKAYGQFDAVSRVTLSVGAGEIVGMLGPNGAGKSTLIKCVAGLLRATSGSIDVGGFTVRTPEARSRTGYIPEVPSLYDLLHVSDEARMIWTGVIFILNVFAFLVC